MLGLGWTELLVIGVVALIVIGPKELPALMHRIGKFAGTIRRMGQDFQRELNKTTGLNEVKNLRASITAPLKATTDAIRKEFNTTTSTGAVQPSGALKPADPKAESVVNEIHAAAGIKPPVVQTPAEAMKDAVTKRVAETAPVAAAAAPVKAARVKAALKAPAAAAVPAKPKATPKKAVAKKAVESPAPVEAIAPAAAPKPAATKKPPVKKATVKKAAEAAPAVAVKAPAKRKPAAKKPAPAAKA